MTAGSVLHRTRTPLHLWFWAAYLVTTGAPGISALQLQRQLGLSRYETAWMMLHKLRRAMVNPERGQLTGAVEVDECFVGGHAEGLRGGREHGVKALVVVAVEIRGVGSGRVRLQVIDDAAAGTLCGFVTATVASGTAVHTDAWQGYKRLTRLGYDHRPRSQRAHRLIEGDPDEILPRVHRVICHLKTWLQGTHRGSAPSTCKFTSTSSRSGSTADAPRWPGSRPCSDSAVKRAPPPTTRSSTWDQVTRSQRS